MKTHARDFLLLLKFFRHDSSVEQLSSLDLVHDGGRDRVPARPHADPRHQGLHVGLESLRLGQLELRVPQRHLLAVEVESLHVHVVVAELLPLFSARER